MDQFAQIAELLKKPRVLPYPETGDHIRRIAAEGMVLLKNENKVLPLAPSLIALFGAGAVDTVSCGTGSGYVAAPHTVMIEEGLRNAGFSFSSEKWLDKFRDASKKANDEDKTLSMMDRIWSGKKILIDDMEITEEELAEARRAETAVYVIRRNAGEGDDRRAVRGDYYLSELEEDNLRKLTAAFAHTVVVLNTCVMDTSFLDTIPGIDALVLMGLAGHECGNALSDVLTGAVNPSGHLTDTWTLTYEDNPASATFSVNDGDPYQEDYNEDIYVGYRYFDSFGKAVRFPFGFGLSYTTFSMEKEEIAANWSEVCVRIRVKNTGCQAGRAVVQVYVTAPEGRLAKPLQVLAAFEKTPLLAPGEEKVLSISFPTENMASFDEERAAFVMEEGNYLIRVGEDSRRNELFGVIAVSGEACLRQVRNEFKPDHMLALIEAPKREALLSSLSETCPLYGIVKDAVTDHVSDVTIFGADCVAIDNRCATREADDCNAKRFADVTPAPEATLFDVKAGRVSMDAFVASLEDQVLLRLVTGAANETPYETENRLHREIPEIGGPTSSGATTALFRQSLGIPEWKVTDGPAGCHLPLNGATAYPTGIVMAQTWDPEAGRLMGEDLGRELVYYRFGVILGPGMNIHRDPLGGRAFEYFSEDPLLSGKTAAAITLGVQKNPGAAVSIKHFACNSQEAERFASNSTVSERALREIYLKGFEICVREAHPKTVMTSYNKLNGIHTSSHYELLTEVLRGEWGFDGMVMTDWGTRSEKASDLHAGNDITMGGYFTDVLLAAMEGKKPAFEDNGAIVRHEFPVYGGFTTEVVEEWNAFKVMKDGPDQVSTEVPAGTAVDSSVQDYVVRGEASVADRPDGGHVVTYFGVDRGVYLKRDDVRACAARVLEQIMDSVSFALISE